VTVEVILDLHHVHPAAVELLLCAKGTFGTALVTDAIRAVGLPDGAYESAGGRTIQVKAGIVRLESGVLAGSYANDEPCCAKCRIHTVQQDASFS
jgi:N-acetylglucosamine-6-phosphate deacetylase